VRPARLKGCPPRLVTFSKAVGLVLCKPPSEVPSPERCRCPISTAEWSTGGRYGSLSCAPKRATKITFGGFERSLGRLSRWFTRHTPSAISRRHLPAPASQPVCAGPRPYPRPCSRTRRKAAVSVLVARR